MPLAPSHRQYPIRCHFLIGIDRQHVLSYLWRHLYRCLWLCLGYTHSECDHHPRLSADRTRCQLSIVRFDGRRSSPVRDRLRPDCDHAGGHHVQVVSYPKLSDRHRSPSVHHATLQLLGHPGRESDRCPDRQLGLVLLALTDPLLLLDPRQRPLCARRPSSAAGLWTKPADPPRDSEAQAS